jgi:hypothetical protein
VDVRVVVGVTSGVVFITMVTDLDIHRTPVKSVCVK